MSETYLDQTNGNVQAKRGRNVEKYKTSYEEEHELYEYINSYSYNLNNLRFKMNSANYQLLLSAMNVLYKLCTHHAGGLCTWPRGNDTSGTQHDPAAYRTVQYGT